MAFLQREINEMAMERLPPEQKVGRSNRPGRTRYILKNKQITEGLSGFTFLSLAHN